jgi:NAD(P)H dehydrogenase (quinone)
MMYADQPLQLLIVYYSRFGSLKALGEEIVEGARRLPNVTAQLLPVDDQPIEELRPGESQADMAARRAVVLNQLIAADAIVVGAPSYFGSLASPVKRLFEDCATASAPPTTDRSRPWRHHRFRDKVGAAFSGSATPHGGNEQTLHSILTLMMHLGMIVVTPGQSEPILENEAAPYGVTVITGAEGDQLPDDVVRAAARNQGEQVATIATWLRLGRLEWERSHRK